MQVKCAGLFPNPCDDTSACNGNGQCARTKCSTTDFTCTCNIGWRGEYCDVCKLFDILLLLLSSEIKVLKNFIFFFPGEISCDASVCLNGGTCVSNANCTQGLRCDCPQIYSGQQCEKCKNLLKNFRGLDLSYLIIYFIFIQS